jgi:integrase
VLTSGADDDVNLLLQLSAEKRLNVMKSLTALSKYLGCYDRWQQIRQRYNLKWSSGNESMQSFERFFNDDLTFDSMLQRIKEMIAKTPTQIGNIIKFACLTGLRPTEAVQAVKLINDVDKTTIYYKPERNALEHFHFPDIFFKQTKLTFHS